jgi:hypothetical protein
MADPVTVSGLEEVQRMLATAPKTIVASGYTRALSAAGEVIAAELEIRTPVKAEDTGGILDRGVLRESVTVEVLLDSQFRGGQVKVGFGKNGAVALWVEYGHRLVGHKPGGKVIGSVPPHPFMRPTAEAAGESAIEAFYQSLRGTVAAEFPQGRTA